MGATSTLSQVAEVIYDKPQQSFIDPVVFDNFVNVLSDDRIANSVPYGYRVTLAMEKWVHVRVCKELRRSWTRYVDEHGAMP